MTATRDQGTSTSPASADESKFSVAKTRPGSRLVSLLSGYGTLFALGFMVLVFVIMEPSTFATPSNFRNIVVAMVPVAVIAAGLTLPLVAGDFDLSLGFVASFCGVLVIGLLSEFGWSIPVAIIAVLACGLAIGVVNGLLVSKLGVNAFIATLGTGTIVVGLNYAYCGGIPLQLTQSPSFTQIALGSTFHLPNLVLIMAIVLGMLWVVLNRTVQGQHIKAIGVSAETSRRAGIAVSRSRIITFAVAGLCAAITGILLASNLGSGQVTAGDGLLLQGFAAAFLGSAALPGGTFRIGGTLIGCLTVAIGNNGLAMIGAPVFTQYVFSGGILICAVALGSVSRRLATT